MYIHAFMHIHFTDPIPVTRQSSKKQDTNSQHTTHTKKLKIYDKTPNNTK